MRAQLRSTVAGRFALSHRFPPALGQLKKCLTRERRISSPLRVQPASDMKHSQCLAPTAGKTKPATTLSVEFGEDPADLASVVL
jgi:hypothetical protein